MWLHLHHPRPRNEEGIPCPRWPSIQYWLCPPPGTAIGEAQAVARQCHPYSHLHPGAPTRCRAARGRCTACDGCSAAEGGGATLTAPLRRRGVAWGRCTACDTCAAGGGWRTGGGLRPLTHSAPKVEHSPQRFFGQTLRVLIRGRTRGGLGKRGEDVPAANVGAVKTPPRAWGCARGLL